MSVKVHFTFACDGCHKSVETDAVRLDSRFRSFSGRDYGFGFWVNDKPDAEQFTPEGWMAFDPYTRCCYCPDCVAEIWPDPSRLWPRGMGGCDDPLRIIPLCRSCHRRFDDPSDPFDLLPRLVEFGSYYREIAHVIEAHEVPLVQLVERLTGQRWVPVDHREEVEASRAGVAA